MDLVHSYSHAGEYSPCFTELQRDFIISRPTKLKSLIRLVKHWYQQVRQRDGPRFCLWRALPGGGGASPGRDQPGSGPRVGAAGRGICPSRGALFSYL